MILTLHYINNSIFRLLFFINWYYYDPTTTISVHSTRNQELYDINSALHQYDTFQLFFSKLVLLWSYSYYIGHFTCKSMILTWHYINNNTFLLLFFKINAYYCDSTTTNTNILYVTAKLLIVDTMYDWKTKLNVIGKFQTKKLKN